MEASSLAPVLTRPLPFREPRGSIVPVPLVAAHRGASGHRPEHTLAAHRTALRMGADLIEVDVVLTADGVPLVRHENELSRSTDVAHRAEFAHRRTRRDVDGTWVIGWFAEDFTLAEIKRLRVREPRPALRPRNTRFDGAEAPATLDEVLTLLGVESVRRGWAAGILIEVKHPSHLAERGLDVVPAILGDLRRHGLDHPFSGVSLMAFEPQVLQRFAACTRVPLVQLLDSGHGRPHDFVLAGDRRSWADLVTPAGLDWIDTYADGIGVERQLVLPRAANGALGGPTELVERAHRRDLTVGVWTLRAENAHLPAPFRGRGTAEQMGDMASEVRAFLAVGVDQITTDHPGVALEAVRLHLADGVLLDGIEPEAEGCGSEALLLASSSSLVTGLVTGLATGTDDCSQQAS